MIKLTALYGFWIFILIMIAFSFSSEYIMFEMHFKDNSGFYNENLNYYCVYTGEYSEERINRSDCHEYCHSEVDRDITHFY